MRRARTGLALLLPIIWVMWSAWIPSGKAANGSNEDTRAPTDLDSLMELLATSGDVRARFQESRHLSILTDPIETDGMLYFAPPDRLARHANRPGRSSVVVEAGRVTFGDETGQRTFDLSTSVVARTLVSNLMVVFRGDLESLRARHSISFHPNGGNGGGWTLELEPRSRIVRGIIERVRFTGTGRQLTAMETHESNGDRTILRFSDIETGLAWDAPELERIFSLDPPDATP